MRPPRTAATVVVVGLLAGCSGGAAAPSSAKAPSSPLPSSPLPSSPLPSSPATSGPASSSTATTAAAAGPVSLPALAGKRYDGGELRLGAVLARSPAYLRHAVTYRSGGLRISGVLNVPRGRGPFPVLVLAHGYIDPAVYRTGQGLRREQDYLASRGYAVLHTDYRNHAGSSKDPRNDDRLRLGYTEDVVNAVLAVRRSGLAELDGGRVGLLGRSMGGGIAFNTLVTQPGLVRAAVVYAPVSSDEVDNFTKWTVGQPERRPLARRIVAAFGSPQARPEFWRGVSSRTYFDRVTEPVLVHHGTADESCPVAWSRETVGLLERAGRQVTYHEYPGQPHAFDAAWPLSMRRTVAFFDRHLRP